MIDTILLSNSWIVKSTLFLLGIILCHLLIRKHSSASTRHLLWVIGFAGMLLIPCFTQISWQVGSAIEVPIEVPSSASNTVQLQQNLPTIERRKQASEYSPQLVSTSIPNTSINWTYWVQFIWIGGMGVCLLVLLVEYILLSLLHWRSKAGSTSLFETLYGIESHDFSKRPVKLIASKHIDIPFTSGWLKPVIYVPADFEQYDTQKQRLVFLHELAHIQRWDVLSTFLTQIACAVFWFNPLMWMAAKWSKIDMEKACDDKVIGQTNQKYDYASLMLDILEASRTKLPQLRSSLAMANKNELKSRMTAILDDQLNRNGIGKIAILGISLAVICVLFPLSFVQIVEKETPQQPNVESVNIYLKQLEKGDKAEKEYAAWVLGTLESRESIDGLITLLDHEDSEIRSMALWALGEIKANQSLPALIEMTADPSPLVREMAAKAIGELENPSALGVLAQLLHDDAIGVRTAAVWALGELRTPKALQLVQNELISPSIDVQKMAVEVLGELRYRKSIEQIGELLSHKNEALKLKAALALDQMRTHAASPYLLMALQDRHASVRASAASSLGKLGHKSAVPALIPLLQDPSPEVRAKAVWALDELEL